MASISFSFIDSTNGINTVSYDIEEKDMARIYDAFKIMLRMPYNPETEDPTPIPTNSHVLHHLSHSLLQFIFNNQHETEVNEAVTKLGIEPIKIIETR